MTIHVKLTPFNKLYNFTRGKMMKKTSLIAVLFLLTSMISSVFAEKEIAEWQVNQDVFNGYAVDTQGEIIMYSNAYSGGLLEVMTYNYNRISGEKWTGSLLQEDFPDNTTNAEIVGLSRKKVLIKYTDTDGNTIYATYTLRKNEMKLHAMKNASPNETFRFAKNKLLSTIDVSGKMTLQEYGLKFKPNKNRKVNGLGIVTEINAPFGKNYVDQSGTVGVGTLVVRVIKN